jgi:hypothetical protein
MISTTNAYVSQAKHRRLTYTCFTFDAMWFSYIKLMLVAYHLYLTRIAILMMMMMIVMIVMMVVVMLLLLLLLSLSLSLLLLVVMVVIMVSKKEEEREINFKVKGQPFIVEKSSPLLAITFTLHNNSLL